MEAWMWLEREVLIAPDPKEGSNTYFLTRRGRKLLKRPDLAAYRNSNLLPKSILHPLLTEKIWGPFLRGEYDTAVFISFREVEVAVRDAAGYDSTYYGVDLMSAAFKPESGPLANKDLPNSEQQALMLLFRGAIGYYKNPQSHRITPLQPIEAIEMITFASHLLKIIDLNKPKY